MKNNDMTYFKGPNLELDLNRAILKVMLDHGIDEMVFAYQHNGEDYIRTSSVSHLHELSEDLNNMMDIMVGTEEKVTGEIVNSVETNKLIEATPDLLDAVKFAMQIQDLWMPHVTPLLPEHENEAFALSMMAEKFKAALRKTTNLTENPNAMKLYIAICKEGDRCFTVNDGWQTNAELAIDAAMRHSAFKAGKAVIVRIEEKEKDD